MLNILKILRNRAVKNDEPRRKQRGIVVGEETYYTGGVCTPPSNQSSSGNLASNDIVETKKCLNCLRRIESHKNKCHYCGSSNFQIA